MEILSIKVNHHKPSVLLNVEKGIYLIEGVSIIENPAVFYQPVLDWLDKYASQIDSEINFVFKLKYFDSASLKYFLEILTKIEKVNKKKKIKFTWYYNINDPDMGSQGLSLSRMVNIPCIFKSYDQ